MQVRPTLEDSPASPASGAETAPRQKQGRIVRRREARTSLQIASHVSASDSLVSMLMCPDGLAALSLSLSLSLSFSLSLSDGHARAFYSPSPRQRPFTRSSRNTSDGRYEVRAAGASCPLTAPLPQHAAPHSAPLPQPEHAVLSARCGAQVSSRRESRASLRRSSRADSLHGKSAVASSRPSTALPPQGRASGGYGRSRGSSQATSAPRRILLPDVAQVCAAACLSILASTAGQL